MSLKNNDWKTNLGLIATLFFGVCGFCGITIAPSNIDFTNPAAIAIFAAVMMASGAWLGRWYYLRKTLPVLAAKDAHTSELAKANEDLAAKVADLTAKLESEKQAEIRMIQTLDECQSELAKNIDDYMGSMLIGGETTAHRAAMCRSDVFVLTERKDMIEVRLTPEWVRLVREHYNELP